MNKRIYLLFILLFIATSAYQQQPTKADLEKKKEKLLKEINSLQSELDKTKKDKNATIQQVSAIKKKIAAREELINTYTTQVDLLSRNIIETSKNISAENSRLKQLQDNYARMVYYTYKHHSSYDVLMFVFSAENFNDAVQRIKYIRRYNTYKKLQADGIRSTVTGLSIKRKSLQTEKQQKKQLLTDQEIQKQKLTKEKTEQLQLAKNLSAAEKKLKANLTTKKKEQEKLNRQIQDIIKREIAAATKAANATKTSPKGGTTSSKSYVLALTPEAKELSNSFAANQGKFPWPVEKGELLESFGIHSHPLLENVTTKNNGIDIKTAGGASVRSIFKGSVVSILTNPVYHRAVIIRHGEYFTVYSNLETVSVKPGDEITTKQVIGKAFTDSESGVTMVHLEVWKGTNYMNPESWLKR